MKKASYSAKAIVNIGGIYKEVEFTLNEEEKRALESNKKQYYSMGAFVNKIQDATLEDYEQT